MKHSSSIKTLVAVFFVLGMTVQPIMAAQCASVMGCLPLHDLEPSPVHGDHHPPLCDETALTAKIPACCSTNEHIAPPLAKFSPNPAQGLIPVCSALSAMESAPEPCQRPTEEPVPVLHSPIFIINQTFLC